MSTWNEYILYLCYCFHTHRIHIPNERYESTTLFLLFHFIVIMLLFSQFLICIFTLILMCCSFFILFFRFPWNIHQLQLFNVMPWWCSRCIDSNVLRKRCRSKASSEKYKTLPKQKRVKNTNQKIKLRTKKLAEKRIFCRSSFFLPRIVNCELGISCIASIIIIENRSHLLFTRISEHLNISTPHNRREKNFHV